MPTKQMGILVDRARHTIIGDSVEVDYPSESERDNV